MTTKQTRIKDILKSDLNMKKRFIPSYSELDKVVKSLKKLGHRVVLTQGVYDLIHVGHAAYLEAARNQGDILIVGMDSDELTRKRKGPDRPVVPQKERLEMLIHLRHVDIVTLREVHHDIGDLIRLVKPDVLVVSKSTTDFTKEMADDYEKDCGKILSLPPQATTSTTARIRNLTLEGAEKMAKELVKITQDYLLKIRNGN